MKTRFAFTIMLFLMASFIGMYAQNVQQMNSPEINSVLKKNKSIAILDVRTAEEYQLGHLKGAVNMDVRQADFNAKVDKLNHKKTYLVYCRTNHRSGMAVDYMKQHGFKTIYQMMDGFPGWASNNLPFEK